MTANTFSASWDDVGRKTIKVSALQNPLKESLGKAITIKTDVGMTSFKVNDVVTAKVKYVGDMTKPGMIFYINNVVLSRINFGSVR